jgi:hypothetical protein
MSTTRYRVDSITLSRAILHLGEIGRVHFDSLKEAVSQRRRRSFGELR